MGTQRNVEMTTKNTSQALFRQEKRYILFLMLLVNYLFFFFYQLKLYLRIDFYLNNAVYNAYQFYRYTMN